LMFLTAPINFLTLGLFTFVINAIVLALTAAVVPGFHIMDFWPTAVLAAIILSVVSTVLSTLIRDLNLVKSGKRK
jgi:putative membrane protein